MVKDDVLKLLADASGEFLSGQRICTLLGVSRTAVWKAVAALKAEGFVIDAITNKGYCLRQETDILSEQEILRQMQERGLHIDIRYKQQVDSTNLRVRNIAETERFSDILFVADEQIGGKGRRGRYWISPAHTGIWMSLLLKPELSLDRVSMITLVMALAVAKAIQKNEHLAVQIKWPNDIVFAGKKLCGILTEMSSDTDGIRYVICGVGINVNMTEFPAEISDTATSLYRISCRKWKRSALIAEIIQEFYQLFAVFKETQSLEFMQTAYEEILVNKDNTVLLTEQGKELRAHCLGINSLGELLVQTEDGEIRAICSGEVSVRGVYGYA